MKTNGQRQDIAFLALAVAVLAVAVALFVAMRSIEKGRQKEPEPEPAQEVQVAEPVAEEPAEPAKGRDPFRTQAGSAAGAGPGPAAQSHALKLVGIVMEQGDKPMAIIHSSTKRYYARVGDRAAGYTVVDIGTDSATLDKDGDRITLVLRQPEPEE